MLIDELIERAFSDGYEYALMEQREYAYPGGMVGTGVSSSVLLAKKSLAPRSPKAAEMWAKLKKPEGLSAKTRESAFRAASQAKADFKKMDPMPAKASFLHSKVSRPAPDYRQLQAKRAGNPFSRASQFLSGPGGLR